MTLWGSLHRVQEPVVRMGGQKCRPRRFGSQFYAPCLARIGIELEPGDARARLVSTRADVHPQLGQLLLQSHASAASRRPAARKPFTDPFPDLLPSPASGAIQF